jgi:ABC-type amino acid transport substrate-binding protein
MRSIWTAIAILLAIGLSLSACQREPASPPSVEKAPTPSVERKPTPAAKAEPAAAVETVPAPPVERELVVAIKEAPPFVMKRDDGSYYGIGIDLWRRVADRLQLRYGFLEQPDAGALIKGIAEGSYDVSFGALSVTADRARLVDFTQPFFATGLGIAVPSGESRLFSVSRILLSQDFLHAVLVLIGIALAVGFVVWLFERRKTDHFQGGVKGLGSGFWWSAVAMTQAGAAQDAPATLPGRFVAICWMIVSIIVITVFTASITSKLTKQELKGAIHGLDDLRFVRVGASRGTATVGYLDRERVSHRNFPDPKDGLQALQERRIDAFVYDRPLLNWMVMQDFPETLRVLDFTVDSLNYAIAMPKGSRLLDRLNIAVLQETESDWWQQTLFQYLRKKQ